MVVTPWGTAESLRARRLRPGPGRSSAEVARNQRQRFFGAVVASVAERGYAATRVSDLVELSGVSRRSFYELFGDKEACLRAAVAELVSGAIARGSSPVGGASWEERAQARFRRFSERVVEQAAAARVCLIESFVAGPPVAEPVEEALKKVEVVIRSAFDESPPRAGMPPEMITAFVGAGLEITRTRLIRGSEAELPRISSDVVDAILAYRPPPEPLRLSIRPPTPAPETIEAHDHRERALRAFAAVAAEEGYANATIEQIVKRAAMSPTTFYAIFSGKEDLLMAAIDSAAARITAAVLPAYRHNAEWPHAVRAAYGAFFNFLASRPALARLLMVEVHAAGPEAVHRRAQMLPLEALLAEGSRHAPGVSACAVEVITGGLFELTRRTMKDSGPEGLAHLAPVATYLTLAPFVGPVAAAEAANGDGRPRGLAPDPEWALVTEPANLALLRRLGSAPAAAGDLAEVLPLPAEELKQRLARLERAAWVERVEDQGEKEPEEPVYRSRLRLLGDEEWEEMSLPERQRLSEQVGYLILGELGRSVRTGAFDRRPDRHLSRTVLRLDERGWRELLDVHDEALDKALEIVRKSEERLDQSGERGIAGRSVQVLFEMPDDD
jgi:AcrR family transcriptional regulator